METTNEFISFIYGFLLFKSYHRFHNVGWKLKTWKIFWNIKDRSKALERTIMTIEQKRYIKNE